jgi:N-acetylneuraminate synthase
MSVTQTGGLGFLIGSRQIGGGAPPFVVAEVAQSHDGSLGLAHAFVDTVADCGADAIKFQTHIAAAESTLREPWRTPFSRQDANRYEYWRRMEFTRDQWAGLKAHAEDRGLVFLSSPFSPEAVDLLSGIGVRAFKAGSGEIDNTPLIALMASTGRPVILSTGLADWGEIDGAVAVCRERKAAFAVLQCTTEYPCPPERVGLNVLAEIRARYGCPTGLSDHSARPFAGLAAVALGADIVEVHVTLDRRMFGPDVRASLEPKDLRQLVQGARFIHVALGHRVDKATPPNSELKTVFGRSLVASRSLPSGTTLGEGDIAAKKPAGGLPPPRLFEILGRRLRRSLAPDEPFSLDDLADEERS